MRILVTLPDGPVRDSFFPPEQIKNLEALGQVTWNPLQRQFTSAELAGQLEDIEVLVTGWGTPRLEAGLLKRACCLGLVAHTGGTVADLVDDTLYDWKIPVISGNPIYAQSVAEGTLAYILAALRRLPYYHQRVQEKKWSSAQSYSESLFGQLIGLVGFGAAARCLVPLLRPFSVEIRVYDPYVSGQILADSGVIRTDLDDLLQGCRIISIHAAKTPDTDHLIDRRRLRLISDGAYLINTSRGSLIDEDALADELTAGRFQAVLDVYQQEPLPQDSRLRGLDQAILMPHMAGPTYDMRAKVSQALCSDIEAWQAGRTLSLQISRDQAAGMTRH